MATKTNYVLIDYENVQPTDLAMLRDGPALNRPPWAGLGRAALSG